jgi:hypothetical protein
MILLIISIKEIMNDIDLSGHEENMLWAGGIMTPVGAGILYFVSQMGGMLAPMGTGAYY